MAKTFNSSKCKCGKTNDLPCCDRARNWLYLTSNIKHNEEFDYEAHKATYENLLDVDAQESESLAQIRRDLNRTFPTSKYFSEGGEGLEQLERVLTAFAKYDLNCGYVQGMNFIVGSLLYHASEEIAFWLFVSLIEDFEIRDIYLQGLPGLYKHCQIIHLLILEHLPKISQHFSEHSIIAEMFASDWVIGLFCSVIPLEEMGYFFDNFFEQGWPFFYKLCLSVLKKFESEMTNEGEMHEILNHLKKQKKKSNISNFLSHVPVLGKKMGEKGRYWESLIQNAKSIEINEKHIRELLSNFNHDTLTFRCADLQRSSIELAKNKK